MVTSDPGHKLVNLLIENSLALVGPKSLVPIERMCDTVRTHPLLNGGSDFCVSVSRYSLQERYTALDVADVVEYAHLCDAYV